MASIARARRGTIVLVGFGCWLLAALLDEPALAGLQWLAASFMIAGLLSRGEVTIVGRLPIAAVVWVCLLLTWFAARPTLGNAGALPWGVDAIGPVVLAGAAVLAFKGTLGDRVHVMSRGELPAAVASGLLLAVGMGIAVIKPFEVWSRNFFMGTDFNRHIHAIGSLLNGWEKGTSGYPLGFHHIAQWTLSTIGGDVVTRDIWVTAASLVWSCAGLTLLAIGLAVQRVWALLGQAQGAPVLVGLAAITYVQSYWFDRNAVQGYVINFLMGLVLAALVAGMAERAWWSSPLGLLGSAAALVVAAHAWQFFIGVTGGLALITFWHWVRTTRQVALATGIGVVAAVLSWPAVSPWLTRVVRASTTPCRRV